MFAALDIATDQVTAACKPRHRHQEFLAFLKQVARAYPDGELHLVMDNYATHKRVEVRTWLAANPRIIVHFTPTSGSWLNLVEVWFGIIERQAIHRGTFNSVKDLNAKIRAFIDGWNDRAHPFVWTKTADQILKKASRQNTSTTGGRQGHAPSHLRRDVSGGSAGRSRRELAGTRHAHMSILVTGLVTDSGSIKATSRHNRLSNRYRTGQCALGGVS